MRTRYGKSYMRTDEEHEALEAEWKEQLKEMQWTMTIEGDGKSHLIQVIKYDSFPKRVVLPFKINSIAGSDELKKQQRERNCYFSAIIEAQADKKEK